MFQRNLNVHKSQVCGLVILAGYNFLNVFFGMKRSFPMIFETSLIFFGMGDKNSADLCEPTDS